MRRSRRKKTRGRAKCSVGLNHYSGLPLLLRDQLRFRPWPEDAPWKDEAEQAARLADHGKWQQAVAIIDRLGRQYGADPTLVFNRAVLGGWLADDRALVAGLHAFAQLDVPLDDAVEAEAVAQLLDPDLKEERLDSVIQVVRDQRPRRAGGAARVRSARASRSRSTRQSLPQRSAAAAAHVRAARSADAGDRASSLTRDEVPRLAGVIADLRPANRSPRTA